MLIADEITKQILVLVVMQLRKLKAISDFFLPHQLNPVDQFLKSLSGNDNKFGIQLLPDITFLRQLAIQGRLVYEQATTNDQGAFTLLSFVPANGSTFFYLGCTTGNQSNAAVPHALDNDGMRRELITTPANSSFTFAMQGGGDALVGDGIKAYTVERLTEAGSRTTSASLFGWVENTSRIRDVTT